jgi:hypothetical protein
LKASSSGPAPRELRARGDPAQRAPHEQGRPEGRPRRSATARRPYLDRHPDAGVGCVRAAARREMRGRQLVLVLGRGDGSSWRRTRPKLGSRFLIGHWVILHRHSRLWYPPEPTFSGSSWGGRRGRALCLREPVPGQRGDGRPMAPLQQPARATSPGIQPSSAFSRGRGVEAPQNQPGATRPARAEAHANRGLLPLITTFRACRIGARRPFLCVQN